MLWSNFFVENLLEAILSSIRSSQRPWHSILVFTPTTYIVQEGDLMFNPVLETMCRHVVGRCVADESISVALPVLVFDLVFLSGPSRAFPDISLLRFFFLISRTRRSIFDIVTIYIISVSWPMTYRCRPGSGRESFTTTIIRAGIYGLVSPTILPGSVASCVCDTDCAPGSTILTWLHLVVN